jgi:hypothetical protein
MPRGSRLSIALAWICVIALFGAACAQGEAVTITPPSQSAQDPYLGSNASGDYLLAWEDGSDFVLRLISGSTSQPLSGSIETLGEPEASIPHPAVAPDGTRGVVWATSGPFGPTGTPYGINVAIRAPSAGTWTIQNLVPPSPENDQFSQELAFGPQGQALAVWADNGTGDRHPRILGSFRPPGGEFGAPYVIFVDPNRAGTPARLSAAFDNAGHPTVVWDGSTTIRVVSRSAGGSAHISGKGRKKRRRHRNVQTTTTYAVTGETDGSFGAPQLVNIGCDPEDFDEAPSGAAAIGLVCGAFRVKVSERAPGGTFGLALLVPGEGHDDFKPQVAVSSNGRVTFGWLHRHSLDRNARKEEVRTMFSSGAIGQPLRRGRPLNRFLNSDDGPWAIQGSNGINYLAWIGRRHVTRIAADQGTGLGRALKVVPRKANYPVFAIDQAGRGVAFWNSNAHHGVIRGSAFLTP